MKIEWKSRLHRDLLCFTSHAWILIVRNELIPNHHNIFSMDNLEDSWDSIQEDEELEISCALQHLTTKIQTFVEQKQVSKGTYRNNNQQYPDEEIEEEDEIEEDIEGMEFPAVPALAPVVSCPVVTVGPETNGTWNEKDQAEELKTMQSHIAQLLAGIQFTAKEMEKKETGQLPAKTNRRTKNVKKSTNQAAIL